MCQDKPRGTKARFRALAQRKNIPKRVGHWVKYLVSFGAFVSKISIDVIDPSVFVDRYVKDPITIRSVQFSPDGQLLATGATDGQIRVRFLKMRMFVNFILLRLDMDYHTKTNASHV